MVDREIIGGCKDAMIALSTTGRKRGFCPIWATQRLAKLDKDASAEFFNRMVGMTIEDVDVDRAADLMSVSKEDKHDFRNSLRMLTPGEFYCFGRAITTERTLVKVGPVETHHPETGKAAKNAVAPPTPEEVKQFLPQLADLPKEAEDKARTEAEMKREIRELHTKLKAAERAQPAAPASPGKTVIKADPQQTTIQQLRTALEDAVKIIAKINAIGFEGADVKPEEISAAIEKAAAEVGKIAGQKIAMKRRELENLKAEVNRLLAKLNAKLFDEKINIAVDVVKNEPMTVRPQAPARPPRIPVERLNGDLSGPEQNILDQLAELEALGIKQPEKAQLSLMAGYTNSRSGGFSEPLGRLLRYGYASYPQPGFVKLTDEGREHARPVDLPMSVNDLHERLYTKLGGPEAKLLRAIIAVYPNQISKEDLGASLGYTNVRSGGFSEPVGRLRSLGIIQYPERNAVRCSDWLFLEVA
jgi:uncharacterized protein